MWPRSSSSALAMTAGPCATAHQGCGGGRLTARSPQADKESRLSRLGIAAENVTFVPLDLDDGGLADALTDAGFEPDTPSLFIAEGITPYLKAETIHSLFQELRAVATVGTRLAISLRRPDADPAARAHFEAGVAALGEPAIGSLTAENAEALLAECRWKPVELKDRTRAAGFVVAAPVFAPAPKGISPTRGRIGTFVEQMLYRRGGDTLAGHLAATYGVPVSRVRELDVGVHKVETGRRLDLGGPGVPRATARLRQPGETPLCSTGSSTRASRPSELRRPTRSQPTRDRPCSSPSSPPGAGRRPAQRSSASSATFWRVSIASPLRTTRRTDQAAPGTTSCSMPLRPRS